MVTWSSPCSTKTLKKLDVVKKVLALIPPLCYMVISMELDMAPQPSTTGCFVFLDVCP